MDEPQINHKGKWQEIKSKNLFFQYIKKPNRLQKNHFLYRKKILTNVKKSTLSPLRIVVNSDKKAISNGKRLVFNCKRRKEKTMKRFALLAMLCAFVLGFAATASAADIKATGDYTFEAIWTDDWGFDEDAASHEEQDFNVFQRLRTKFSFIANENLKGVLYTEVGTDEWGSADDKMVVGETAEIRIKQGYLDFNWPGTSVNAKVGYQAVALPNAVGTSSSAILAEETGAAVVSGPITENVSYALGYARPYQGEGNEEQIDVYFATLPLAFDNINVTPFFAYANIGGQAAFDAGEFDDPAEDGGSLLGGLSSVAYDSSELDNAWWAGASFEGTFFNDFVLKADLNYGTVDGDEEINDRSGWLGAISMDYTGWKQYVTPELFFVYTSGEDDDTTDGSERMPFIDQDWAVGSFFFGGDWGLKGSMDDGAYMGFWTLGLSLKDISFLEGLNHTVNIMYIQGTNDDDLLLTGTNPLGQANFKYGRTLTEEDSMWEVDLNTSYKIYDELTGYVELGWLNADYDEDTWGDDLDGGDAYKLSVGMNYSF